MEDYFKSLLQRQEKLDIKVGLAKLEDWPVCKKLRLKSIEKHPKMFGVTRRRLKEEKSKTDQEWQDETSSVDMFSVLAWNDSEPVGLGRAKKVESEEGIWHVRNGYVEDNFHGMGIQQRMIALRLSEIIKRGGVWAVTGVNTSNAVSLHNVEKFGFKVSPDQDSALSKLKNLLKIPGFVTLELDLTDPTVVNKINEVLNVG